MSSSTFKYGFLVDVEGQSVHPAQAPFTCAGIPSALGCAPAGQLPGPVFFGDEDSWLCVAFEDAIATWGCPQNHFVWNVASGTTVTVTIDESIADDFGGTIYQYLPLDLDGDGKLGNLVVAKLSGSTGKIEFRTISSNTSTVIYIASTDPWDATPASGDTIIVAPLAMFIAWGELRSREAHRLAGFMADVQYDASPASTLANADAGFPMRFQAFTPPSGGIRADHLIPATTKWADADDLASGKGDIRLSPTADKTPGLPISGRASSLAFMGIRPQSGTVKIGHPFAVVRALEGDAPK